MPKSPRRFHLSLASIITVGALLPLSVAFAADFPVGTFVAGSHLSIVFAGNGQFHVTQDKATQVSGTYTVKGDQVELTDKKGPWACNKEGMQSGTYKWQYVNSTLSFSKVSDSCEARVGSLARTEWKHAK